jgi:F-type H+-transporting ATPase subunit b
MLDFPPDITFFIQFFAFFILFFALDRLLFKPYLEILSRRDARTTGASRSADEDQHAARELRSRIDEAMAAARVEAQIEAEGVRRQARAEEASLYDRAKADAASRLADLSAALDKERAAAHALLRSEAKVLADQMTRVVLGDKN